VTVEVVPYNEALAMEWDSFCATTLQGTLLHTRKFLSYHADRFVDQSLLIKEDGRVIGMLPAALHRSDTSCVVSHPGATYGGIVHTGYLRGRRMLEAMSAILRHYRDLGAKTLVYKSVPIIYHRSLAQDDLYAIFRLGGRRTQCDLSSTICLTARLPISERRRRSLRKALQANTQVIDCSDRLSEFWTILSENLARKYEKRPVHTVSELELLVRRFPNEIKLLVALVDGQIEAGTLLFRTPTCDHAQYIAASQRGNQVCALDAVFDHCITAANSAEKRWFDFGISTEDSGQLLNEGLYGFKSEFGAGGTLYESYELSCHNH
jgi:hypothetical protein